MVDLKSIFEICELLRLEKTDESCTFENIAPEDRHAMLGVFSGDHSCPKPAQTHVLKYEYLHFLYNIRRLLLMLKPCQSIQIGDFKGKIWNKCLLFILLSWFVA